MRFFFITNSPSVARFVADSGVDRIFVDLEIIGKVERQGHLSTVISRHDIDDVGRIRKAVPDAELMARLNPLHDGSPAEVEAVLAAGADVIMQPMFRSAGEVRDLAAIIDGRCRLCALVETADAARDIEAIAVVPGVSEVHVGLNDMSLDLRLPFMFTPLRLGIVDRIAEVMRKAGKPFGIGGLARADEGLLPARLLIGEHVRLGSSAAILSRTFHRQLASVEAIRAEMDFAAEVEALRYIERQFAGCPADRIEANRSEVARRIALIEAQVAQAKG